MSLRALPHDVRELLCASAQINTYKRAIEELIYNSLDAESTSIAIRVNIAENRIHVIDNGCGIMKNDFNALGVRYMTSKLTDITTLKSIPKCYGYRGEFLANIIEISQCVKITSRYKVVEETWTQTFYQGKKRSLVKNSTRPSKGTTIEIKEFLYNLNIQKQGIDAVIDLLNVKAFLEQLAIVHNDISLSLRDDSRNEIVFKIHKKRDVYQTLFTLFDINKGDVQELQIVKSQYKAIAYFGKRDTTIGRHWVYVNGKFIENSSKLHKIIYGYLKKYLLLSDRNELKSRNHRKEEHLFKSSIPFYFILITCPYIVYDVSFASCQSVIEFKNWEQITLLLEKLIKFYVGDVNLKHVQRTKETVRQTNISTTKNNYGTSGKIKNIINKILGTNSKRLKISQLQHGIKGKLIKRNRRQKNKDVSSGNAFLKINEVSEVKSINVPEENMNLKSKHKENLIIKNDKIKNIEHNITIPKNKRISEKNMGKRNTKKKDVITKNGIKTSKIKKNKKKNQNKVKNMSLAKTVHTPVIKNNLNGMKPNEMSKSKDINREFQYLEETDAVVTKSRNVNQKVNEFYKYQCNCHVNRPNHVNEKSSRNELRGAKFQVPLPPKANKNAIVKYKMKVNPFKTTYDLVQTILESDQERIDDNSLNIGIEVDPINNHRQTSVRLPMNRLTLNDTISNYTDTYCRKDRRSILKDKNPWYDINNIMPGHFVSYNLTCEKTYSTNVTKSNAKRQCKSKDTYNFYSATNESVQISLKCADIFKENSYEFCTQNNPSSYLSNTQALSKLTYDSHNYKKNYQQISYRNRHHNEAQNMRFITKQSKDNFISNNSKYLQKRCFKNKIKKSLAKRTEYYSEHVKQTIDESYMIEFTTSNEMKCSKKQEEIKLWNQSRVSMYNVGDNNNFKHDSYSPIHEPSINFGNTYTIPTHSSSHAVYHNNNTHQHAHKVCESICVRCPNMKRNDTVVIEKEKSEEKESHDIFTASKLGCFNYDLNTNEDVQPTSELECIDNEVNMDEDVQPTSVLECIDNDVNMNEGVQSNSKLECIDNVVNMEKDVHAALKLDWFNNELNIDDDIQPIKYCETVFGENASIEKEFAFSFNRNNNKLNNSLYNNIDENNENIENNRMQIGNNQNIYENISHHFSNVLLTNHSGTLDDFNYLSSLPREKNNIDKSNNIIVNNSPTLQESNTNYNKNIDHVLVKINEDTFNFKDRLRFLPKGMSQIFEKSGSKAAMCNPDTDYYEDIIYNDFADDIQMQTEIYEPAVQNLENFNTIDIQKFKNKVQKDNTSLIFDENSLKEAQMLNQVDNKFIAAIMDGRHRGLEAVSKYLVLFDQHAVHERIRLERNLASYFNEDKWNSVPLNNVTLKMSKDEILYLHNYKNKFNQLGLQWTVLDPNTVLVNSIPEAILGKNPREVDKVMKAVKNLIIEEINVIKLQKGCISLHPKSIMDLMFSEACRYAIKFGDKLSKNDCIDLISDLSNCKTPFQCAHGRPVIAVLLDIKNDSRDYKINMTSLNEFKLKRMK